MAVVVKKYKGIGAEEGVLFRELEKREVTKSGTNFECCWSDL